jgi:hypothetical protein
MSQNEENNENENVQQEQQLSQSEVQALYQEFMRKHYNRIVLEGILELYRFFYSASSIKGIMLIAIGLNVKLLWDYNIYQFTFYKNDKENDTGVLIILYLMIICWVWSFLVFICDGIYGISYFNSKEYDINYHELFLLNPIIYTALNNKLGKEQHFNYIKFDYFVSTLIGTVFFFIFLLTLNLQRHASYQIWTVLRKTDPSKGKIIKNIRGCMMALFLLNFVYTIYLNHLFYQAQIEFKYLTLSTGILINLKQIEYFIFNELQIRNLTTSMNQFEKHLFADIAIRNFIPILTNSFLTGIIFFIIYFFISLSFDKSTPFIIAIIVYVGSKEINRTSNDILLFCRMTEYYENVGKMYFLILITIGF